METSKDSNCSRQRTKTDKSLGYERAKTDTYLDDRTVSVESESDETIQSNRRSVDQNLKLARESADRMEKSPQDPTRREEHNSVLKERAISDKAQIAAREIEDKILSRERFNKRLIAEALLLEERSETDTSLSDERRNYDSSSKSETTSLSDEKEAHDKTKTALVTRDQFVAMVSHDLKNPISAISMSSELALDSLNKADFDREEIVKFFNIINRNALTMDRIVSGLLDVQKMENDTIPIEVKEGDLVALINECKDLFSTIVNSKGLSLSVELEDGPYSVPFDHDRLLQVLSNLMGNAVKFSKPGTSVKILCKHSTRGVEILVKDEGYGIPQEKTEEIFEKFSQLKSHSRQGLGLGLFISRRIVEAHHGTLTVVSTPNIGSTFSIFLPL